MITNNTLGGSYSTPQKEFLVPEKINVAMEKLNRTTKIGMSVWAIIIVIIGVILIRNYIRFSEEMRVVHENILTGIITSYEFTGRDAYDLTIENNGHSKVIHCPAFGKTIKSIQIGDSIYKAAFSDSAYFFRKDSNGVPRLKKVDTIRF